MSGYCSTHRVYGGRDCVACNAIPLTNEQIELVTEVAQFERKIIEAASTYAEECKMGLADRGTGKALTEAVDALIAVGAKKAKQQ